jgi:hypothetical protein
MARRTPTAAASPAHHRTTGSADSQSASANRVTSPATDHPIPPPDTGHPIPTPDTGHPIRRRTPPQLTTHRPHHATDRATSVPRPPHPASPSSMTSPATRRLTPPIAAPPGPAHLAQRAPTAASRHRSRHPWAPATSPSEPQPDDLTGHQAIPSRHRTPAASPHRAPAASRPRAYRPRGRWRRLRHGVRHLGRRGSPKNRANASTAAARGRQGRSGR